jgi:hypothetical protein
MDHQLGGLGRLWDRSRLDCIVILDCRLEHEVDVQLLGTEG